jgi:hypothetical protein
MLSKPSSSSVVGALSEQARLLHRFRRRDARKEKNSEAGQTPALSCKPTPQPSSDSSNSGGNDVIVSPPPQPVDEVDAILSLSQITATTTFFPFSTVRAAIDRSSLKWNCRSPSPSPSGAARVDCCRRRPPEHAAVKESPPRRLISAVALDSPLR